MAGVIRMAFEGGNELEAALRQLSKRTGQRVVREVLGEGGEPIRLREQQLAPVGPGSEHISQHIVISTARATDSREGGVWIGPASPFFYGAFLEHGTVKMSPQPFARPAFDSEHPRSLEIVRRAFWRELAARGVGRSVTAPTKIGGGLI